MDTPTTDKPATFTKKILIVDNEPHIRILLSQALHSLTKEGVQLTTVDNGDSALKLIELERPNLVFLDLMMPGLHGFDVCRLIKSDYNLKNTYIIILSARSQSVDKMMGSVTGADEYIVKPFNPLTIADKARSVLGLTSTSTSSSSLAQPATLLTAPTASTSATAPTMC